MKYKSISSVHNSRNFFCLEFRGLVFFFIYTVVISFILIGSIIPATAEPVVSWTIASQNRNEDVGTMTVTAELSGSPPPTLDVIIPFSVSGTANDPNDYTITPSPIVIPFGSTTATITITVADDTIDEIVETVIVTMGDPNNATKGTTDIHTATITDNDAPPEVNWTTGIQNYS